MKISNETRKVARKRIREAEELPPDWEKDFAAEGAFRPSLEQDIRQPEPAPPSSQSTPKTPHQDQDSATAGNAGDSPAIVQINATGLSDTPVKEDGELGFPPYVRALAWFLSSHKTQPPLTISVEGPWGCGKSSFMLQLNDELQKITKERKSEFFCVKFNPWRSDKDEALWAAFALTFMRELEKNVPWHRRVWANIKLLWHRFDWKRGKWQIAQLAALSLIVCGLAVFSVFHPEIRQQSITSGLFGTAWVAAVVWAYKKSKSVFGNPLSIDLRRYVRNLRYEEKIAFIERFQEDFSQIVSRTYLNSAA